MPSSPAAASILLLGEERVLLVDRLLAIARDEALVDADVRRSGKLMEQFDADIHRRIAGPFLGIVALMLNDVGRLVANHIIGATLKRRRMLDEARAHGLAKKDARRFVDDFVDAWTEAARYNSDIDYQRKAVRRALG